MKRMILFVMGFILFTSFCYSQTTENGISYPKATSNPDNGTYYSTTMKANYIFEYGVASCPYGYTIWSMDKKINHGWIGVDEFAYYIWLEYYKKVSDGDSDIVKGRDNRTDEKHRDAIPLPGWDY